MARNKIVTSVSLTPEVFKMGRDEGYNFSELLEEAIIDRNDPQKEIAFLQGQIQYHQEKIHELNQKIEIVKKAENKIKEFIVMEAIEHYLPDYRLTGVLRDSVERRLCEKLKLTPEELVEVFDEHL
jgi:predicted DNA-binding protein